MEEIWLWRTEGIDMGELGMGLGVETSEKSGDRKLGAVPGAMHDDSP
jgi:hypothetical protein